jgi:dihydroneopterin aldolase/2-amino-4-hydroxy-6-hydroxymethyldihydropteridine diphosphokinase
MDNIRICNLEVFARHGASPEERALGQKFVISASLAVDLRSAGKSDRLEESIDYSEICGAIKRYVEGNTFCLIETVAEGLAELLLTQNPLLKSVRLEVKKPWAPVGVQLETVSVEIERGRHSAYIALGSNIGDREAHLNAAVAGLNNLSGCRVVRVSKFIDTEPYGYTGQDNFLNGCLELETLLGPLELLEMLHQIENSAGRVRDARWGPRTLDLDILFYDDTVMSTDGLRIPHIEAHKRDFVLIPLNEIAPNLLHPILGKTVREMLEELGNDTVY